MANNFSTKLLLEELDFEGQKFIFNLNKSCAFFNFFNEESNDVIFSVSFIIENIAQNKNIAHRISGIMNFSFSKLTEENNFFISYTHVPYIFKKENFMRFFNETFERLLKFFTFCFNEILNSYIDFFQKSSLPGLSKVEVNRFDTLSKVTVENIDIFMKFSYSNENQTILSVYSKHRNFYYGNENLEFNISCYTNDFQIEDSNFRSNVFIPRVYSSIDFPPFLRLKLLLN